MIIEYRGNFFTFKFFQKKKKKDEFGQKVKGGCYSGLTATRKQKNLN